MSESFQHNHEHIGINDLILDPENLEVALCVFPPLPLFAGEIPAGKLGEATLGEGFSGQSESEEFDVFLEALERLDKDPTPQKMHELYQQFPYRHFLPIGDKVYVDVHPQKHSQKPILRFQRLFRHPFDPREACDVMYRAFKEDDTIEISCAMCAPEGEPKGEILVLDPNCSVPTFLNLYFDYDDSTPKMVQGPSCERRFRDPRLLADPQAAREAFYHERLHARDEKTMEEIKNSLGRPKIIRRPPSGADARPS